MQPPVLPPDAAGPAPDHQPLTDCDREPIHIPGAIQPHGALLVLEPGNLAILQRAGDLARLFGPGVVARAGGRLHGLLPAATIAEIAAVAGTGALESPVALDVTLGDGQRLELVVHETADGLLLEIEAPPENFAATRLALQSAPRAMCQRVAQARSIAESCQAAAEEVRTLTGFDRIMVYRFLPDGSGVVEAEARDPTIASYLGLHYPDSDIPRQARALYLRTWARLIPDAGYRPSPLTPALNPRTGKPTDLSLCALRSVSPLHLEYLANMGVRASLSLSLVRGGRLWGLIIGHHHRPRPLPYRLRQACETFAQMLSLQLEAQEQAADFAYGAHLRGVQEDLLRVMAREEELAEGLIRHRPNLLDCIQAEGVAVNIEGRYAALGRTPPEPVVRALAEWIAAQPGDGVWSTDRLPALWPDIHSHAAIGAGVLALAVSRDPRDCILWFRPELPQTVTWAGDPRSKPPGGGPDGQHPGGRLGPRRSFAAWQETVRGRAKPWTPVEIEAARSLRITLLEVVLRRLEDMARERASAKDRQDFLMAELDHRVKNTLANIQALVRHTSGSARSVDGFVRDLEGRLHAMAGAHSLLTRSRWEGASLRQLVEATLQAHRLRSETGQPRFTIAGVELHLKPKAALALSLALYELATNAVKYGALSVPEGRLEIAWWPAGEDVVLEWAERDGPPVRAPTRRGFGSTVLERGLAYELGGRAVLDYAPEGLRCRIVVPRRQMADGTAPEEAVDAARPNRSPLRGRRILVVEASAMVALELERALAGEGAEIVGPVATLDEALPLAREAAIDAALVDGDAALPVVNPLAARAVPFALIASREAEGLLPPGLRHRPVLARPCRTEELLATLGRLLEQAMGEGQRSEA